MTPADLLWRGICRGDPVTVRAALVAGADPTYSHGEPALSLIVTGDPDDAYPVPPADLLEIARLLLDAGADPTATDARGTAPIWWAEQAGDRALADLLRAAESDRLRSSVPPAPPRGSRGRL